MQIPSLYLIILDLLTFLHFGEAEASAPTFAAGLAGAAEPAGVAVPLKASETAVAAPATTDVVGIAEGTAVTAVAVPLTPEMTGG